MYVFYIIILINVFYKIILISVGEGFLKMRHPNDNEQYMNFISDMLPKIPKYNKYGWYAEINQRKNRRVTLSKYINDTS